MTSLSNTELAREIVERLNALLESRGIVEAIGQLLLTRIPVGPALFDHPSLQVNTAYGICALGPLGLLNGIVGAIPSGPNAGCGYIVAVFENGTLVRFKLSEGAS